MKRAGTALLALQDRQPSLRAQLSSAWRSLSKWQELEPSTPHMPTSRRLACAVACIALMEGQRGFALCGLLQFFALLRPGEALGLRREHACLPEDSASEAGVCFFAIPKHKGRQVRTSSGAHHACIRDSLIVDFVRGYCRGHSLKDRLYLGTFGQFTRLWKKYLGILGVACSAPLGFTPASLRAGGATWLYTAGMPVVEIMWLLRHEAEKTARHYIQAAAAAQTYGRLSSAARSRTVELAAALPELLERLALPPPTHTPPIARSAEEATDSASVVSDRARLLRRVRALSDQASPSEADPDTRRGQAPAAHPASRSREAGRALEDRRAAFVSPVVLLEDVFRGLALDKMEKPVSRSETGTTAGDPAELHMID